MNSSDQTLLDNLLSTNEVGHTTLPVESDNQKKTTPYTAVVFFHGMGSQRRYEEVSWLVETLETYDSSLQRFARIEGCVETSRLTTDERPVGYITLDYRVPRTDILDRKQYRFYEVYWAYVTAGGIPMYQVLFWVCSKVFTPRQIVRSPWCQRVRYRVKSLHELSDHIRHAGQVRPDKEIQSLCELYTQSVNNLLEKDIRVLLTAYDSFVQTAAGNVGKGQFQDFRSYLKQRAWSKQALERAQKGEAAWQDADEQQRVLRLAESWHRYHMVGELENARRLTPPLVAVISLLLGLVALLLLILTSVSWVGVVVPTLAFVSIGFTLALDFGGVKSFLQDYLGDVMFWTTYTETDQKFKQRAEILKVGSDMLRHVLEDDNCGRIVVVAHSLGSTVAYETLLAIGQQEIARTGNNDPMGGGSSKLERITHLITFGSPIDKIFYFFGDADDTIQRYRRVREQIRGDISSAPLTKKLKREETSTPLAQKLKPHIHWINFWDEADVISGPLYTPLPLIAGQLQPDIRIDNVQVNTLNTPYRAHSSYTDQVKVQQTLYQVIFENKYNFTYPNSDPASQFIGPGEATPSIRHRHDRWLFLMWLLPIAVILVLAALWVLICSLRIVASWIWMDSRLVKLKEITFGGLLFLKPESETLGSLLLSLPFTLWALAAILLLLPLVAWGFLAHHERTVRRQIDCI